MKYKHPTITIEQPVPGHYVIAGHHPAPVFVEGEGHVVPPQACYIAPEVPSEALRAVLEAREQERDEAIEREEPVRRKRERHLPSAAFAPAAAGAMEGGRN